MNVRWIQVATLALGIVFSYVLSRHPETMSRIATPLALAVLFACIVGDSVTEAWIERREGVGDRPYHIFRIVAMYPIEAFVWLYHFEAWWPDRIVVAVSAFTAWVAIYKVLTNDLERR